MMVFLYNILYLVVNRAIIVIGEVITLNENEFVSLHKPMIAYCIYLAGSPMLCWVQAKRKRYLNLILSFALFL